MIKTWPTKKLGEIFEENKKSSFKVSDADNSGKFPFFTSGKQILTHSQYLVDGENLYLSTGGQANIKYFNGKASYSTDTWSLKVNFGLTKYVYYSILTKLNFINNFLFRGSGLKHLQKKEFLVLEIPLPPLSVQKQIVEKIEKLFSKIDEAEKLLKESLDASSNLFNSALQKVFKRGEKEGWEIRKLGEVSKIFGVHQHHKMLSILKTVNILLFEYQT